MLLVFNCFGWKNIRRLRRVNFKTRWWPIDFSLEETLKFSYAQMTSLDELRFVPYNHRQNFDAIFREFLFQVLEITRLPNGIQCLISQVVNQWNFLINTYIARVDFSDDNDDISFTKLLEFHQEYLIETKLEVFENEVTSNEESCNTPKFNLGVK